MYTMVSRAGHATALLLTLAAAVAAAPAPYGSADFVPTPERPLGWRGDGSGLFPGANPPTAWDVATGKGVVWKADLPQRGRGGLIVVGGLVISTAEPNLLLGHDANQGTPRWQVKLDPTTAMTKGKDAAAAAWNTVTELIVRNKFSDQSGWPADDVKQYKVADLRAHGLGAYDGETGWMCQTPVTDGTRVYAACRGGAVVAVGLDGAVVWQASLGALGHGSPLLADGLLVVPVQSGYTLVALDAATGVEKWRTKLPSAQPPVRPGRRAAMCTPALMTLGGTRVVVAGSGDALALDGGALLGQGLFPPDSPMDIATAGNLVLQPVGDDHAHGMQGVRALRLSMKDGAVVAEKLWEATEDPKAAQCGAIIVPPLAADGVVYTAMNYRLAKGLRVRDAATGEVIAPDRKLPVDNTPHYMNAQPLRVGPYLMVVTTAGTVIFVRPGGEWAEAARASLGGNAGATPCPVGSRLYARTETMLYCLGEK